MVLLSVEFGRPVLYLLGGTSTSKKTTTLQPTKPSSGPLTTETWANASAPSTLTKPMPSGLQRTTAPPTAFLKRASCNDALSQGRSTKSAARPMPPATRRSSQPSRCSPGPRPSCRPSQSCPGPGCSRPPSPTSRSPSARQCLGQRQSQAPHNLSAVDTRHAPLPC